MSASDEADRRPRRALLRTRAKAPRDPREGSSSGELSFVARSAGSSASSSGLAKRWQALYEEIGELDTELGRLVKQAAPNLLALPGVGTDIAGTLLVSAGDNPERLANEAWFAALCGTALLMRPQGAGTDID